MSSPLCRLILIVVLVAGASAFGQAPPASSNVAGNVSIDLKEAVRRAQVYSQQFLSGTVGVAAAQELRKQAKSALLPSASLLSQYALTQPNGSDAGVFVANNGTHEYIEQATVHSDIFSVTRRAEYRKSIAAEATARARVDIAARGIVVAVAQNYYALLLAQRRLVNARNSLVEAQRFETLTQNQERGGEVARADVVKAQLQREQRERDTLEAEVSIEKAKIGLAVLVFQDIDQAFSVLDDLKADLPLPEGAQEGMRALVEVNSPDIRAAEGTVTEAQHGVQSARGELFPVLSLDVFYGLDSNVVGIHNSSGQLNIGTAVVASITLPVWNWGATRSRIRSAELQRQQAEIDLKQTRRDVRATLESLALEVRVAQTQIGSLQKSMDTASENLRLTNLRYQGGEALALEVVDAQNTAALARDAYDTGLSRYRIAVVNLQTLTGTF
ncbi:MAG: TolC family protein [Acidobacteriota bacterium]